MNLELEIPSSTFNEKYLNLLDSDKRYLIFYGGAGSGKSVFVAQRYIIKLLSQSLCNILCVRAVGNTNRDSTFAVFKQIINRWGLTELFKIGESELRIRCLFNQNTVIFKGLDDSEKLKSITFEGGELTDIWIEEASEISEDDFKQLDVRLRGEGTKKQIVLSFNPIDINHWLKHRFFDTSLQNSAVLKTTYKDNKFLDDDYREILEAYKDYDRYYYDVYCLGNWGVFGNTIFNAASISDRLSSIAPPLKTGYFAYTDNGLALTNIEWVDDECGGIKIYCNPEINTPYVLGGDTSGDGSDNFTAQVINNISGKQAAILLQKYDEDLYAKQVYCLATFYNNALVALEANFSTFPIRELERLGYTHQYLRQSEDEFTHKIINSYGFRTTSLTRPLIIAEIVRVVRENVMLICDKTTLEEMLTFVRNEKGRAEAQKGSHDDCIMALAIAHFVRPQQSYTKNIPPKIRRKWEEDMIEDYHNASPQEKAMMDNLWGKGDFYD